MRRSLASLFLLIFISQTPLFGQKVHLDEVGFSQSRYIIKGDLITRLYFDKTTNPARADEVAGQFFMHLNDFRVSSDSIHLRGLFTKENKGFARNLECVDCGAKKIKFSFDEKKQMVNLIAAQQNYSVKLYRSEEKNHAIDNHPSSFWVPTDTSYWFSTHGVSLLYGTVILNEDTARIGIIDENRNGVFGDKQDQLSLFNELLTVWRYYLARWSGAIPL